MQVTLEGCLIIKYVLNLQLELLCEKVVFAKEPLRHFLALFIYFLGILYVLVLGLPDPQVKVSNE